jgi:hypothetical protein
MALLDRTNLPLRLVQVFSTYRQYQDVFRWTIDYSSELLLVHLLLCVEHQTHLLEGTIEPLTQAFFGFFCAIA